MDVRQAGSSIPVATSAPATDRSPVPAANSGQGDTFGADGLRAQSKAAGTPAVAFLAAPSSSPTVNFASFLKGFSAGSEGGLSGKGFVGAGTVSGSARMVQVSADGFQLQMNVKAPFTNRKETMQFTRSGDAFVSRDGDRFSATSSDGGKTLTLQNLNKAKERVVLHVPQAGVLEITSYGFGNDGKTLVATAR